MNGSKIKIPIYREFSSKSFGQTYLKAVLGENQSIPLGHAKDHKRWINEDVMNGIEAIFTSVTNQFFLFIEPD